MHICIILSSLTIITNTIIITNLLHQQVQVRVVGGGVEAEKLKHNFDFLDTQVSLAPTPVSG